MSDSDCGEEMKVSFICKTCSKEFNDYPSAKRKYCSMRCAKIAHSANMKLKYKTSSKYRERLSKALRKSNRVFEGKTYEEIYGVKRAKEVKRKLRLAHLGQVCTDERRTKVSKALKGHPFWGLKKQPEELCLKKSKKLKGRKLSLQARVNIGLANKKNMKKLWKNPVYRNRQVALINKGWKNSPTKPERFINKLIKTHELPFEYNGSTGKIVIGGKIPDFISTNSKKVIEVFGRLFHDPSFPRHLSPIKKSQTHGGTMQHYQNHGYDCLIIWEDEIQNSLSVITAFSEGERV